LRLQSTVQTSFQRSACTYSRPISDVSSLSSLSCLYLYGYIPVGHHYNSSKVYTKYGWFHYLQRAPRLPCRQRCAFQKRISKHLNPLRILSSRLVRPLIWPVVQYHSVCLRYSFPTFTTCRSMSARSSILS